MRQAVTFSTARQPRAACLLVRAVRFLKGTARPGCRPGCREFTGQASFAIGLRMQLGPQESLSIHNVVE